MSDQGATRPERHRAFFALWPDDATRGAISRATRAAVQASGGRPIAKERLHLTVAFLGELTDAGLAVARGMPPIDVGAFDLTLDAVGVWPESRVLWLAPVAPPAALPELEARLWSRLVAAGFVAEDRVYRPHVTLARRARPVEIAVEPVHWSVHDLALVESFPAGRSVHYEVVERWPLAATSTGQKPSSELQ
jgi:RNA 2',3'-cyclic 3'-phosphodiesterase